MAFFPYLRASKSRSLTYGNFMVSTREKLVSCKFLLVNHEEVPHNIY